MLLRNLLSHCVLYLELYSSALLLFSVVLLPPCFLNTCPLLLCHPLLLFFLACFSIAWLEITNCLVSFRFLLPIYNIQIPTCSFFHYLAVNSDISCHANAFSSTNFNISNVLKAFLSSFLTGSV